MPPSSSTSHVTPSPPSIKHRSGSPSNKTSASSDLVGGVSHYFDNDEKDSTRTLFVGNLDNDIERDYLRHLFDHFGIIEEIDLKINMPVQPLGSFGAGSHYNYHHNTNNMNPYAFIRFQNMDMVVEAKNQMNGKRLNGRNECKIGYGNLVVYFFKIVKFSF